MMKHTIIFIIVLCSLQLHSQKNAVYGTLGFNSSINIERTLITSKSENFKLNLSAGLGIISEYNISESQGKTAEVALNFLAGGRGNFLEAKLGVGRFSNFTAWEFSESGYWPVVSLGYRFEKKHFLLRAGFGFPEYIYVGGGLRF